MSEIISVRVNEKKLVANLGHAFSKSKTVLSELMQNSRRAKATKVVFTFVDDGILTIEDDGIGISDFADLLHIAESGWDAETKNAENAFGMGWLSCLFAAKHVLVVSNGKKVEFDTESAIAMKSINVETSDEMAQGTKITLSGFGMRGPDIESALFGFAKGFPIDVIYNDLVIPRPHAIENLNGVVKLKDMHAYIDIALLRTGWRHFLSSIGIKAYLQGLPIYDNDHLGSEREFIFHLNSDAFVARMPDRDCLIDVAKHSNRFTEVARELVTRFLKEEKARLSANEFVRHWHIASRFDLEALFNDVPVLPKSILRKPSQAPVGIRSYDDGSNNFADYEVNVSREDVESGKVVLCDMDDFSTENTNAASWVLAAELGWVHVDKRLDKHHWARNHIKEFATIEFGDAFEVEGGVEVEVEPLGDILRGKFHQGWVTMNDVIFCSSYRVKTADGEYSVINADTATSTMIDGKFTVVVPAGDINPGWVVEQLNDYESDETFYEDQRDDDEYAFNGYAAAIRGECPEETLKKVLSNGNAHCFPNLVGKKLLVEVQEDGSINVMTH